MTEAQTDNGGLRSHFGEKFSRDMTSGFLPVGDCTLGIQLSHLARFMVSQERLGGIAGSSSVLALSLSLSLPQRLECQVHIPYTPSSQVELWLNCFDGKTSVPASSLVLRELANR